MLLTGRRRSLGRQWDAPMRAAAPTRALLVGLFMLTLGVPQARAQSALEASRLNEAGAAPSSAIAVPPLTPIAVPSNRNGSNKGGPVPDDDNSHPSCLGGVPEPMVVRIGAGQSRAINLPERVIKRRFADPDIAYSRMVSPQLLYLVGQRLGSTNAIFQVASGRCVLLDITVEVDTAGIGAKLAELMPNERDIQITAIADSIVLSGTVSDTQALDRVLTLANAFARNFPVQGGARDAAASSRLGLAAVKDGTAPIIVRVINMLSVSAAQQVLLEVKVAEVSKTLIDKLGASFAGTRTSGNFTFQLLADFLSGAGASLGVSKNPLNQILIDAEKRDGMLRILAEPSVLAISGQEGSFLAGGRVLIPVTQGGVGGVVTTLQEKEFGVGLTFTPHVLGDGRINLKVSPEVSELSREGVGVTSGTGTRSVLPLINTRRATTTVQLRDGQSFAIGGLIRSSSAGNIRALPVLGELPVIGALFRSTDFQNEKTELVFIVTPRLVKPLPADYQLPTDRVADPKRGTMLLEGRLDSPGPASLEVR